VLPEIYRRIPDEGITQDAVKLFKWNHLILKKVDRLVYFWKKIYL
jgi:hypothetical protein